MSDPMHEPSHPEVQSLLGAYALDAADPAETAAVERHLRTCVRCATEVAQHHEVAGLLANSGGEAPDHLWDGIANRLAGSEPPSWDRLAARLGEDPPSGPPNRAGVVPMDAGRRRRRRAMGMAGGLVAAAAAVVAVVLGVQVAHLHHQLETPALTRAEQAALAQRSTERVLLSPPAPARQSNPVTVVLTASGTGFVEGEHLAALPAGRTYQLWGVVGGTTISLGLLGREPHVVPFSAAGHAGLHAFAISAEPAGGAVRPSRTPVVEGALAA